MGGDVADATFFPQISKYVCMYVCMDVKFTKLEPFLANFGEHFKTIKLFYPPGIRSINNLYLSQAWECKFRLNLQS